MARKFRNDLTAEDVRCVLLYDPETGAFVNRQYQRPTGHRSKKSGYVYISLSRTHYLAHRLAWLYVYGSWPTKLVDHIDGDGANNAIANLREASDVENMQNSRCKGFYWCKTEKKYRAQITVFKKRMYLGFYDSPAEARLAYEAASKRYFGEFSSINRGGK